MKYVPFLASAMFLIGGAASADVTQDVIDGLKAAGYQRIEIQRSPTRLRVEATKGTQKLEQVIDRATGEVLREERNGVTLARGHSAKDTASGDDSGDHHEAGDDSGDHEAGDDHGSDGADHESADHDSGGDHGSGGDHESGGDHGGRGGDD